jgi:hypothetical protein
METKSFFDIWPGIFLVDLFRNLIISGFCIPNILGDRKKLLAAPVHSKVFPQGKNLIREFAYSMSTVIFSQIGFCNLLADQSTLYKHLQ